MAQDELDQSRTEAPTPRRREEARAEGKVAFSSDLTTGLMLLFAVAALAWGGRAIAAGFVEAVQVDLLHVQGEELELNRVQELFWQGGRRGLKIVGFFLFVIMAAAVLVPVVQVGFHLTPGMLGIQPERLSPTQGWQRLFSLSSGMRGILALFKVAAIVLAAYWIVTAHGAEIAALSETPLRAGLAKAWSVMVHLGLTAAGLLVVFGLVDYGFQRWRHEQSLRMSRQEIKDEMKRDEGDPLMKARIRKLQREVGQKKMLKDVPSATVVITNPTHLAIALKYDAAAMGAPRVVAKGAGFIAQRIIDIARRHAVSVVERKPLAQALFKTVPVGQEIPAGLYLLVAEVLALVYRWRGLPAAS